MTSALVYTCINKLIDVIGAPTSKEVAFATLATTIAVIALASSIFAHPIGIFITTSQDIFLELAALISAIGEKDVAAFLVSLTSSAWFILI